MQLSQVASPVSPSDESKLNIVCGYKMRRRKGDLQAELPNRGRLVEPSVSQQLEKERTRLSKQWMRWKDAGPEAKEEAPSRMGGSSHLVVVGRGLRCRPRHKGNDCVEEVRRGKDKGWLKTHRQQGDGVSCFSTARSAVFAAKCNMDVGACRCHCKMDGNTQSVEKLHRQCGVTPAIMVGEEELQVQQATMVGEEELQAHDTPQMRTKRTCMWTSEDVRHQEECQWPRATE